MAGDDRSRGKPGRRRIGIPQPEWGDNVVSADFSRGRNRTARRPDRSDRSDRSDGAARPARPARPVAAAKPAEPAAGPSDGWPGATVMRTATGLADSGRLSRGRGYYRADKVASMSYEMGSVSALVTGTQLEPFDVHIHWRPLTRRQTDYIVGECRDNPENTRKLLAGQRPDAAVAAVLFGVDQYAGSSCSCPDPARFCKHRVSVCFALAEEFTRDPGEFLAWRGIDLDPLLAAAAQTADSAGSAGPTAEEPEPSESADTDGTTYTPEEFWGDPSDVPQWDGFAVEYGINQGDPHARDAALRKVSWNNADQLRVLDSLTRCYEALTVLDDPDVAPPGSPVFEREPWMSGAADRSGDHD